MNEKILTTAEARKQRRETVMAAMQFDRRLTKHEAMLLQQELADYVASDPEHDPAKHLGVMSDDMAECPQCHALMAGLHVIRDHLARPD